MCVCVCLVCACFFVFFFCVCRSKIKERKGLRIASPRFHFFRSILERTLLDLAKVMVFYSCRRRWSSIFPLSELSFETLKLKWNCRPGYVRLRITLLSNFFFFFSFLVCVCVRVCTCVFCWQPTGSHKPPFFLLLLLFFSVSFRVFFLSPPYTLQTRKPNKI